MTEIDTRHIPLDGPSNFRDLGGYPAQPGKLVRWRRVYRSDNLAKASEGDLAELQRRRVRVSLDFRGVHESAEASYELPGVRRHSLSIEPTATQRMKAVFDQGKQLDEATMAGFMEDLYRSLVTSSTARYQDFFNHLLGAEEPLVFHCTAGKDRTGIAAALLLSALGVSREVVMQDFLLTNGVYRAPVMPHPGMTPQATAALWGVRPAYLQAAWQVIDNQYGGTQAYLRDVLALKPAELDELSRKYLQPA